MSLEERRQAMKLTDKQTDGNNFCPICGYPLGNHNPWGDDGKTPTYDICPCCGVEWGNEDYTTESQAECRKQWLESGTKWFEPQKKSDNWNLEKQLRNIGYNKGQCIGNDYFNNFLSPLSLFPNTLIW